MRTSHPENQTDHSQKQGKPKVFRIVSLLLVVAAIMVAAVSVFSSRGVPKARADTAWTPVWSDNFDGGAGTGLDPANWRYDIGTGWGTGEIENMTNSTANVQHDGNGHLKVTAIRDGNGNWTSGRIESQRSDFAAPAGGQLQVSASIQQLDTSGAAAAGYWPAFWMLGSQFRVDHNWPNDGEIDIMEDINGRSSVFGTLHCGVNPGGPCNESTGIGSGERPCPGCQTGFHTYSMIVDRSVSPEQIRWYLDDANYFTINANQVDPTTWSNAVDHGFFIIFDLAMGGGFPNSFGGGPNAQTQPSASMIVDNVQVSTSGGSNSGQSNPAPAKPAGAGSSNPVQPAPAQPTGNGFNQSASSVGTNQAQLDFHPNGWSAGYVIAHYTVAGGGQQNVKMNYNGGSSSWQYTIGGVNPGNVVNYSFTYQKAGLQYDTQWYSWTHP